MKRRGKLDRREDQILTAFLPHVVLPLVRRRIITRKSLQDAKSLYLRVAQNARTGTREMQMTVGIHEPFLEESIRFWRRGKVMPAVVLYATAVEQYLNLVYQLILMAQGWRKPHITSLLREVNVDSKLGWMYEAFTKRHFPRRLGQRLRTVFAVRNGIVHFKGEVGHPDRHEDSHSKIAAQVRGLRRMSFSRDFRLLSDELIDALYAVDPARNLMCDAVARINNFRASRK